MPISNPRMPIATYITPELKIVNLLTQNAIFQDSNYLFTGVEMKEGEDNW